MENQDFSALDDAICEVIASNSVHPTNSSRLQTIVVNEFKPKGDWWRLVDRRLQAMRKTGRLVYSNTGRGKRWKVAEKPFSGAPGKDNFDPADYKAFLQRLLDSGQEVSKEGHLLAGAANAMRGDAGRDIQYALGYFKRLSEDLERGVVPASEAEVREIVRVGKLALDHALHLSVLAGVPLKASGQPILEAANKNAS